MKTWIFLAASFSAFILSTVNSNATVTIQLQAETLRDQNGVAMTSSGLFLLVSSTTNAGFGSLVAGSSTAVGQSITGDSDYVVLRGNLVSSFANYGVDGVLDFTATGIDLSSVPGWSTGDPMALLWFPTLTTASTTIPEGTPYGMYTNATAIDGSDAWVTPNDPSTARYGFFTQDGTNVGPGANPNSAGNASYVVGAVPEPSRTVLGFVGLSMLMLRRRRC